MDALGQGKKRPAVTVTINGYTYRSTIAAYGDVFMLPLAAENREAAGVAAGDDVEVDLERDRAPREVEVPADLAAALADEPEARAFFDGLSYSNRRWFVLNVTGTKIEETRRRRMAGEVGPDAPRGAQALTARLYRDGALADGRSDRLERGVSMLAEDGRIAWIRPAGSEGPLPAEVDVVDAGGTTAIPGMVDSHSHLTLPGGSHWIDRGADPTDPAGGRRGNARLLARPACAGRATSARAGGSGTAGRSRSPSGSAGAAAGSTRTSAPPAPGSGPPAPAGLLVEAAHGDALLAAALRQLDDGADLVKLYLDGPDRRRRPCTGTRCGGWWRRCTNVAPA